MQLSRRAEVDYDLIFYQRVVQMNDHVDEILQLGRRYYWTSTSPGRASSGMATLYRNGLVTVQVMIHASRSSKVARFARRNLWLFTAVDRGDHDAV